MRGFLKKHSDPREITNDDAAQVYDEQGAVFVDVREPNEWASGHMPGAIHIPLGNLAQRSGELPKDRRIITVCRSGGRSLNAIDTLARAGFGDVKSMAGGMIEWSKRGRPVE